MDRSLFQQGIAHIAGADPVMARVIERVGPYDFAPRSGGTHFEVICRSIVFQQLSGKAAATIYGRFAGLFEGGRPEPAALPAIAEEQLRSSGLSRQKIGYLRDLAARSESGEVLIDRLHELPDDEIEKELVRVHGIGRWTAQMFLIFRLGRPDVLPDLDLGIRKGIQRAYDLAEMPTSAGVHQIGAPWRPFASVASLYLWRSLDARADPPAIQE